MTTNRSFVRPCHLAPSLASHWTSPDEDTAGIFRESAHIIEDVFLIRVAGGVGILDRPCGYPWRNQGDAAPK